MLQIKPYKGIFLEFRAFLKVMCGSGVNNFHHHLQSKG